MSDESKSGSLEEAAKEAAEEEKQLWIDNNKSLLEVCDKKDELINELLRTTRVANEKHSSALGQIEKLEQEVAELKRKDQSK